LVDESIFMPQTVKVEFDSVYNAAFHGYKRHYLARDLSSLLLIGYAFRGNFESAKDILRSLPSAVLANRLAEDSILPLSPQDVANRLPGATTGLCLSAIEGAMYASMEYLMSGLPVVSTLSLGGRDYFFDDDFVRIVDPDPMLIRAAVNDLKSVHRSSQEIRLRTLLKVREQRSRLLDVLNDVGVVLTDVDHERQWSDRFRHGMLVWGEKSDLQSIL
jgi:hypothetical protein